MKRVEVSLLQRASRSYPRQVSKYVVFPKENHGFFTFRLPNHGISFWTSFWTLMGAPRVTFGRLSSPHGRLMSHFGSTLGHILAALGSLWGVCVPHGPLLGHFGVVLVRMGSS